MKLKCSKSKFEKRKMLSVVGPRWTEVNQKMA
jgi:hypothetical protein